MFIIFHTYGMHFYYHINLYSSRINQPVESCHVDFHNQIKVTTYFLIHYELTSLMVLLNRSINEYLWLGELKSNII